MPNVVTFLASQFKILISRNTIKSVINKHKSSSHGILPESNSYYLPFIACLIVTRQCLKCLPMLTHAVSATSQPVYEVTHSIIHILQEKKFMYKRNMSKLRILEFFVTASSNTVTINPSIALIHANNQYFNNEYTYVILMVKTSLNSS